MQEEYTSPMAFKKSNDLFSGALDKKFTVEEKVEKYGDYTKKTAEMLGDSFMSIHMIFTREKWPLEKIMHRYYECSKLEGKWKRIMWYSKRKKDKS